MRAPNFLKQFHFREQTMKLRTLFATTALTLAAGALVAETVGIAIDYQQVIKGLVLLAAVIFEVYNKSKQA